MIGSCDTELLIFLLMLLNNIALYCILCLFITLFQYYDFYFGLCCRDVTYPVEPDTTVPTIKKIVANGLRVMLYRYFYTLILFYFYYPNFLNEVLQMIL